MWHRVAPQLADKFTLIVADLPGYGWSDMPDSDKDHTPYTKRAMAQTMIEAMEQLGHVHFALAGHDRGGRVAYRLALDHPGRLSQLAVLDILPTYDYWERMNRLYALKIYHWTFLAQPYPLPETADRRQSGFLPAAEDGEPDQVEESRRDRSARAGALSGAVPRSLAACTRCARITAPAPMPISRSTRQIATPARRSRSRCWRCGAMPASPAPRQRRSTPGRTGRPTSRERRSIAGHFLTEENPDATAKALREFLRSLHSAQYQARHSAAKAGDPVRRGLSIDRWRLLNIWIIIRFRRMMTAESK